MINSFLKRTYYFLLRCPMRLNGWIYKNFRCPEQGIKVHLGPGQNNYIEGWVNVDANLISSKIDLWANLLDGLPFRDNSVEIFYSHHVIEHLPDSYLAQHFAQMFKALRPGGGIRIGCPHAGNACRKYVAGDYDWFWEFPYKRESLGGRFTNFVFCAGEHLTALDETYLRELAKNAGFVNIQFKLPCKESDLVGQEVLSKEFEDDFVYPHTLILEAQKKP
jgi:predicted SAM-dependent methyltransferase